MHRAGISTAMVRLVHLYLCQRAFKVKLEGKLSTVRTATAGVPNRVRKLDDVRGRRLHLRKITGRADNRPPSPNSPRHLASLLHPGKSVTVLFSRSGLQRRRHGNQLAELTFQGGIIPWRPQIKHLEVILDSRVNCGAHIHCVLDCRRQMSGTLYLLLIGRGKLDPSRNHCDHPCEQTPGFPEPDTADGPQRYLVRKEHHATQKRRSGATHRLHTILRPSGGAPRCPRAGVTGLRSQDPLELPSTRTDSSAQAANHNLEMEPSHFVEDVDSLEPKED
ncbi:hypothetical protein Trydic_g18799 [Trypoxylus dichotomus]